MPPNEFGPGRQLRHPANLFCYGYINYDFKPRMRRLGSRILGWQERELPWRGSNLAYDQSYMRRMTAHHEQGIQLALLATDKAQASDLRALARLMAANQKGEIAGFRQWWRSWFAGEPPPPKPAESPKSRPDGSEVGPRFGTSPSVCAGSFCPPPCRRVGVRSVWIRHGSFRWFRWSGLSNVC
jgi:hypothetical protein